MPTRKRYANARILGTQLVLEVGLADEGVGLRRRDCVAREEEADAKARTGRGGAANGEEQPLERGRVEIRRHVGERQAREAVRGGPLEEVDHVARGDRDPRRALPDRLRRLADQVGRQVARKKPAEEDEPEHEVVAREEAAQRGLHRVEDVAPDVEVGVDVGVKCGVAQHDARQRPVAHDVEDAPPPPRVPDVVGERPLGVEVVELEQRLDGAATHRPADGPHARVVSLPAPCVQQAARDGRALLLEEPGSVGRERRRDALQLLRARLGTVREAQERQVLLPGELPQRRELQRQERALRGVRVDRGDRLGVVQQQVHRTISAPGDREDPIARTDAQGPALRPPVLIAGRVVERRQEGHGPAGRLLPSSTVHRQITGAARLVPLEGRAQLHCPPLQVVLPGHCQLAWHPETHTPPEQIIPAPFPPGLHAPSLLQDCPDPVP